MKGSDHFPRLCQMRIKPPSLFDCFNKVDLGKSGIISESR
jgi:hypothetical protein